MNFRFIIKNSKRDQRQITKKTELNVEGEIQKKLPETEILTVEEQWNKVKIRI